MKLEWNTRRRDSLHDLFVNGVERFDYWVGELGDGTAAVHGQATYHQFANVDEAKAWVEAQVMMGVGA